MYYVYLILCDNDSIYIGITNNPPRRFKDHRTKSGGWHTKLHKAIKLLYTEKFPTKKEALKRERQLKGWSKGKKKALIEGNLALLKQLSKSKSG